MSITGAQGINVRKPNCGKKHPDEMLFILGLGLFLSDPKKLEKIPRRDTVTWVCVSKNDARSSQISILNDGVSVHDILY